MANENYCVVCGTWITEDRQVCKECEREVYGLANRGDMFNSDGYFDPTAGVAIKNVDEPVITPDEDVEFHRLLNAIFYLCELAGFRIDGRIVLVNKKNGRVWR